MEGGESIHEVGVGICIRLVNADEDEEQLVPPPATPKKREAIQIRARLYQDSKQTAACSEWKRALTSTLAERTRCTTALILCLLQAKCQASCAVRDESPLAGDGEDGGGFG
nr:unnamed protein product [Digitaria exilis]